MAPSKIPYPDRGQGISFFSACCPFHPLDLQTSASMLLLDSARCHPPSARQASLAADGCAWVVCCDALLTTHTIVIVQVERFVGRGAGMQRALVVGMSLACLNTVGMAGGWGSSGGEEEAFGFSALGISVRGGSTVNFRANHR